jgi:transcriptional regulator with XRE-family HTH domain
MGTPEGTHQTDRSRNPEEAFGLTLRRIRKSRGVSQQWLADKSGYHRTYIGMLEQGQKSPSLRTIFNIAMTLQVKPSRILEAVERIVGRAQGNGGRETSQKGARHQRSRFSSSPVGNRHRSGG